MTICNSVTLLPTMSHIACGDLQLTSSSLNLQYVTAVRVFTLAYPQWYPFVAIQCINHEICSLSEQHMLNAGIYSEDSRTRGKTTSAIFQGSYTMPSSQRTCFTCISHSPTLELSRRVLCILQSVCIICMCTIHVFFQGIFEQLRTTQPHLKPLTT